MLRQTQEAKSVMNGLLLGGLGVAVSSLLLSAGLAQGGELKPAALPSALDLLRPIANKLSGRMYMLSQGKDPQLAIALAKENEGRSKISEFQEISSLYGLFSRGSTSLQAPGAAALVPFRDPAPAFSRNTLVTRDVGDVPIQTEPHLAVNPKDPDHVVMGVIDYNTASLVSYVTQDGGASWEGPFQAPYVLDDLGSAGDPVLAFDRQNRLYMTGISIGEEEFQVGPYTLSTLVSSMSVARSDDAGFSWPQTFSSARSSTSTELTTDRQGRVRGSVTIGFLDKPWIFTGPNPKNPQTDNVYLTYTDFETIYEIIYIDEALSFAVRESRSTIRLVASSDGGVTWSKPVAISPTVREAYGEDESGGGDAVGKKRVVQGSNVVVGSDGAVSVAYLDSTDDESFKGVGEIYVARSTDGGVTFSKPVLASSFNELNFRARTGNFRYWGAGFPQMAIGPKNELYIVYTARSTSSPRDDADIFFIRSTDGGRNWTRPKRLNADTTTRVQCFPAIAVSPKGVLHAMWLDFRDDKSEMRYHVYYTKSEDGGNTWGFEQKEQNIKTGDTRVTDFPSNPNKAFPGGAFIGDYLSIKATNEDVYMIWPDSRLGEFGGFNQKIGFARQRTIKSPEIFVSPSAGPGGQTVTVQGFNYQPESTIFIQLGNAVIAVARSNTEGRFSTTFFMPVTGEGAQNMAAVDASGNVAGASFFSEFGFNNIQTLLKGLQGGGTASNGDLAKLLAEIQKSQTQYSQLQQQLAQLQKTNQQLYQQLMQRLNQLQNSLPKR